MFSCTLRLKTAQSDLVAIQNLNPPLFPNDVVKTLPVPVTGEAGFAGSRSDLEGRTDFGIRQAVGPYTSFTERTAWFSHLQTDVRAVFELSATRRVNRASVPGYETTGCVASDSVAAWGGAAAALVNLAAGTFAVDATSQRGLPAGEFLASKRALLAINSGSAAFGKAVVRARSRIGATMPDWWIRTACADDGKCSAAPGAPRATAARGSLWANARLQTRTNAAATLLAGRAADAATTFVGTTLGIEFARVDGRARVCCQIGERLARAMATDIDWLVRDLDETTPDRLRRTAKIATDKVFASGTPATSLAVCGGTVAVTAVSMISANRI